MVTKQYEIHEFPLIEINDKLDSLKYKLSLCGRMATKNFYCKKCSSENKPSLLKSVHSPFYCEIRYCSNPKCLVERFTRQMKTFDDIKRFNSLRSLFHFVIGFPSISEKEFKTNFSKIKKRQEYVLNRYFEKLRKVGLNIQAIRVLDFSFETEGRVFMHYHFGAIPMSHNKISDALRLMHRIRDSSCAKMRIKTSFHIQSFGLASKSAVLSYLSIRASGMYKYDMTSNFEYKHVKGNLRESIENHKYIFLSSVLTEEEYLKTFYKKAMFACIGGLPRPLPHGSNITDNIPSVCPIHGILERCDLRIEVLFEESFVSSIPPPISYEKMIVEVIKC